jgi:hypothetical protein
MNGKKELRTITVWQYLEWRCEYCDRGGASELRLYMAEHFLQSAQPRDTFEMLERSASWLSLIKGIRADPGSTAPIPDRRSSLDRRAVPRGGRRGDDHHG